MRSGDPGWEVSRNGDNGSWRINCEPKDACWKIRGAWGTPFSAFRFAIPELCGFQGRAVYLDVDMLVLGDVAEFLSMPIASGYRSISLQRTDVSVINCAWFKDKAWWPPLNKMKASGWVTFSYCELLRWGKAIDPTLDPRWNVCDRMDRTADPGLRDAKLLHYTVVPTQVNRPYAGVTYSPHPWKSWVDVWHQHHEEASAARS